MTNSQLSKALNSSLKFLKKDCLSLACFLLTKVPTCIYRYLLNDHNCKKIGLGFQTKLDHKPFCSVTEAS